MTRGIRAVLLLAGLTTGGYGVLRLLDLGWANFRATLVWLVGGVVLHDGFLAPATIALSWVALRLVTRDRLAPWVVGFVLLGPLTLLAVPVLGRYGARADNPTLLDRPYWAGWSTVVAVVCLGILVVRYVGNRRRAVVPVPSEGGDDGAGDGGR